MPMLTSTPSTFAKTRKCPTKMSASTTWNPHANAHRRRSPLNRLENKTASLTVLTTLARFVAGAGNSVIDGDGSFFHL